MAWLDPYHHVSGILCYLHVTKDPVTSICVCMHV